MSAIRVLTVVVVLAFGGASARAEGASTERLDLHLHRDPTRVLVRDSLVGGAAGLALGGSFLGVMSAAGQDHRDWVTVLATSAGIGLAVGLLYGTIQSGTAPSPSPVLPPGKDGLSFADQHRRDLSGTVMLPVFGHRF